MTCWAGRTPTASRSPRSLSTRTTPRSAKPSSRRTRRLNAFIKKYPADAAKIYLDLSGDRRSTAGDIVKMITDPDIDYTTTPANVMTLVEFMRKTNRLKNVPASWKDMFLPVAHGLRGA